ncbi:MAG TPA: monovalent cation/H(+) antiporter subunit G [Hyphomicrobium sp.]|nr:monovalent cation/H(+) antiporter subunit G [Hyphomicrobium sp.]HRO48871.1 monovalent cation/H(+) antiporter subunit G [Hyphomicrobium sp.]
MTHLADLPAWAQLIASFFILIGALVTLIGAIGLLTLRDFYDRIHAPTLGSTWGTGGILLASILIFSVLQSRPVLHEVLIAVFVTVTMPVVLMLLGRAALYRDRTEGIETVPSIETVSGPSDDTSAETDGK